MIGFKPLFWPTLFTLPAILVLAGLGFWQLERRVEKRALLDEVAARMAAPIADLPADIADPEALKFRPVRASGVFLHDKEIHLLAPDPNGRSGYQIITPLRRDDGSYVLVNRGWVPQENRDAATRLAGQVEGKVTIAGLARPAWPRRLFVPENVPEKNFWFFGDLDAMAKAAGLTNYAPVFLEADATPNPDGLPIGGQTRITFPNDHLQYAITWFGLGAALIVIYFLYHRSRGRL